MSVESKQLRVFRFTNGRYNLAVHAYGVKRAREYVRSQAVSSLTHRSLRYVGEGPPSNTTGWVGANAEPRACQDA